MYTLFEASQANHLAVNMTSTAVGFVPGCGGLLSFALSEGVSLYEDIQTNELVSERIRVGRYSSATSDQMMVEMREVLRLQNSMVKSVAVPDALIADILDKERMRVFSSVPVFIMMIVGCSAIKCTSTCSP